MSDSVILLNRCQNPYKVRANRSELPECEAFKRQVLYILNRLSPENYNKLVIEFLNLPLDCEQSLKDCVELIWFKCLVDHIYSSMYAKLCRVMSETRVELQFMPDKYISFGAALVKQCQREFYRDFKSHIDIDGYNEKIRRAISDRDENRRIEIESELSERVSQARHEYIGNLIFMSELFKLDMIEERLLFDGVEAVFKRVNEESLENIEFISMLIILVAPKLKKRTESIKVGR